MLMPKVTVLLGLTLGVGVAITLLSTSTSRMRRVPGPGAGTTPPTGVAPALRAEPRDYAAAEAVSAQAIRRSKGIKAVQARHLQAFATARRKNYRLARERFALLRQEAARLPDGGKQEAKPGEKLPTLEEEGAYQHAVLTAALGEKSAAEREYLAFLRDFPESPLVHAAVRRLAKLHGGELTAEAEAARKQAMAVQAAREKERVVASSLCGPEVVSEILRRSSTGAGQWVNRQDAKNAKRGKELQGTRLGTVADLAREMGTDERGSSLKAVAEALRRRGFRARGLRVTFAGLRRRALGFGHSALGKAAVITLVQPGHYVLVEAVSADGVWVWDPAGGKPVRRFHPKAEWERMWSGVVLVAE